MKAGYILTPERYYVVYYHTKRVSIEIHVLHYGFVFRQDQPVVLAVELLDDIAHTLATVLSVPILSPRLAVSGVSVSASPGFIFRAVVQKTPTLQTTPAGCVI